MARTQEDIERYEQFEADVLGLIAEHDIPTVAACRMLVKIAKRHARQAETVRERKALRWEMEDAE
jgi:hypothetical protein